MDQEKNNKNNHIFKIPLVCAVGNSFTNWIKLLFDNKFKIDLKYIPKAILVTFITLSLTPFVILEKIIFNNKIKKTKVISPVFIIGHMRTGTTFLHNLMSRDSRFAFVTTSEAIFPWVFLTLGKFLKLFMRLVLPKKRPMDDMEFSVELPQEDEFAIANLCLYSPNNGAYFPKNIERYFKKYTVFENESAKVIDEWKNVYTYFMQKMSFKSGRKRVLSKNHINSTRIKLLLEMFPDAKFIFIYRDPYKLFLSTRKLYEKFILKDMNFQSIELNSLDNIILEYARKGFEKYFTERSLIKNGNLIEIKFEDFVKDPLENLRAVYKELSIGNFEMHEENFKKYLKKYENYKPDNYNNLNEVKDKIYQELKIVFDTLGYSR